MIRGINDSLVVWATTVEDTTIATTTAYSIAGSATIIVIPRSRIAELSLTTARDLDWGPQVVILVHEYGEEDPRFFEATLESGLDVLSWFVGGVVAPSEIGLLTGDTYEAALAAYKKALV